MTSAPEQMAIGETPSLPDDVAEALAALANDVHYEVLYPVSPNADAIEATWSDPDCVGVMMVEGRLVAIGHKRNVGGDTG